MIERPILALLEFTVLVLDDHGQVSSITKKPLSVCETHFNKTLRELANIAVAGKLPDQQGLDTE